MFSKSTFECLSLKTATGNFFLRPDYILGVFRVDHSIKFEASTISTNKLNQEKESDEKSVKALAEYDKNVASNIATLNKSIETIRRVNMLPTSINSSSTERQVVLSTSSKIPSKLMRRSLLRKNMLLKSTSMVNKEEETPEKILPVDQDEELPPKTGQNEELPPKAVDDSMIEFVKRLSLGSTL